MYEPNLIHNMCTVQLDTETTIDTLLEEAGPPPSTKIPENEQLVGVIIITDRSILTF